MAKDKKLSIDKNFSKSSRPTPLHKQNITKDKLKALLPKGTSIAITDEILFAINTMGEDSDLPQELLEEDLMSYMHLLGKSTNGFNELVNAIKYCNLKRNYSNKKSWSIVFPHKYDKLVGENAPIDNHVSMYNKSKLVTSIDKEMLIPVHLQYAGYFHKGVAELYKIGVNNDAGLSADGEKMTVSPMVKVQALKELVAVTRAPEETKIDLKVGMSDEAVSLQQDMNDQLRKIVKNQKQRLEDGESIIDVQAIGVNFNEN